MQTIGCDPYKGLTIYKDGKPVAQFNNTRELAHIAQECMKVVFERLDDV